MFLENNLKDRCCNKSISVFFYVKWGESCILRQETPYFGCPGERDFLKTDEWIE